MSQNQLPPRPPSSPQNNRNNNANNSGPRGGANSNNELDAEKQPSIVISLSNPLDEAFQGNSSANAPSAGSFIRSSAGSPSTQKLLPSFRKPATSQGQNDNNNGSSDNNFDNSHANVPSALTRQYSGTSLQRHSSIPPLAVSRGGTASSPTQKFLAATTVNSNNNTNNNNNNNLGASFGGMYMGQSLMSGRSSARPGDDLRSWGGRSSNGTNMTGTASMRIASGAGLTGSGKTRTSLDMTMMAKSMKEGASGAGAAGGNILDKSMRHKLRLAKERAERGDVADEPPPPEKKSADDESDSDSHGDPGDADDMMEFDAFKLREEQEKARLDDELQADIPWFLRQRTTDQDGCLRHNSLFFIPGDNRFRLFLYNICRHWVFEGVIIAIILFNCVILAMDDPLTDTEPAWVTNMNIFFVVAFTVEMVWKFTAFGFALHEGAYLKNNWNVLDFVIVCLSYLQFSGVGRLSSVRAVRVLRPLRSMNAIPELRALVIVLLDSLKGLLTVLLLTFFVFGIFGIFGVQLFNGVLHYRCVPIANETDLIQDARLFQVELFCNPSATPDGINGAMCPEHFSCEGGVDNPNFGKTSCDNFFWTLLLIVQTITFEDWAHQMYGVMAALTPFAAVYFVLLVIIGGYMLLNLALAIISFEFDDQKDKMERKKEIQQMSRELAEQTKEFQQEAIETRDNDEQKQSESNNNNNDNNRDNNKRKPSLSALTGENSGNIYDGIDEVRSEGGGGIANINTKSQNEKIDNDGNNPSLNNTLSNTNNSRNNNNNDEDFDFSALQRQMDAHVIKSNNNNNNDKENTHKNNHNKEESEDPSKKKAVGFVVEEKKMTNKKLANSKKPSRGYMTSTGGTAVINNSGDNDDGSSTNTDSDDSSNEEEDAAPPKSFDEKMQDLRDYVFEVVEGDRDLYEKDQIQTTLFSKFIILCIFFNTVVLAADHYEASSAQEAFGTYANLAFTVIFILEIILKVFALGPWLFCQSGFNVFDFLVVLVSLIELGLGGNSQFSVFRAFRLLRVLKLLKKFPSLLKIVNIIGRAVKETAYMNVLVLLYLFVSSLFGMSLFGGKMADPTIRSSFDSFGWSFLTVFQVLTRDNWPNLMFSAMQGTSDAAALYFLFCVFFGDLVILNLFLSIVISTFEVEDREINSKIKSAKMDPRRRLLAVTAAAAGSKPLGHRINYQQTVTAGLTGNLSQQKGATQVDAAAFRHLGVTKTARDFILYDDPVHAATFVAENNNNHKHDEDEEDDDSSPHNNNNNNKLRENSSSIHFRNQHSSGGFAAESSMPPESQSTGVFGTSKSGTFARASAADKIHADRGVTVEEMMFKEAEEEPGKAMKKLKNVFGKNRFADIVLAAQAASDNTIGNKILAFCPKCKDPIVEPFNLDSHYYQSLSPLAQHEKICDRVQVRKARNRIIAKLLYYIQIKEAQRPIPYAHEVEEIFGTGWEVGILLGDDLGEHLSNPSWDRLYQALQDEAQILCLRLGEDYIGGSLIAFTTANTPTEKRTNGGDSLWLFSAQNRFRILCTNLMLNDWFDRFILVCIVISSISLAFDTPRVESAALTTLGDVFSGIFIFEATIKIISLGFLLHRSAYLRDPWNILDFFIVIVAIVDWAAGSAVNISFLKVFRTFRALRPLRVINRNQGLKMVVITLFESFKGIFNVALITVLIWLIFAILGTQLFGGTLYRCTDASVGTRGDCVGSFIDNTSFVDPQTGSIIRPYLQNVIINNVTNVSIAVDLRYKTRQWVTPVFNFDNTYNSFLLLFGVATLDSWSDRMYTVIDAQGVDVGPLINNQPYMAIYFLLFIIIGSFFLLSLFVGVVIAEYGKTKNRLDCPWPVLDDEQKHWVETQRMVLNFRPVARKFPPVDPKVLEGAKKVGIDSDTLSLLVSKAAVSSRTIWRVTAAHQDVLNGYYRPLTKWESLRVATFDLIESVYFEVITGVVVLLSIIFIAFEHYDMDETWSNLVEKGNYVFVGLFVVEMLVKWMGLGLKQYFLDPWADFDFFLVLVGLVGVSIANLPFNVNLLRILRVFRTMRLLALVRRAKRVRILLETLWFSLPALANVSLFLLLVFFIYSVLGVQLFTFVQPRSQPGEGGIDGLYSNFANFGTSFLLLVRIATLDNWGVIMTDVSNTQNCGPSTNAEGIDTCGTALAPLYFFSFLIIAVFVQVNILVAIILDNFNTAQKIDHSDVRIQDLKQFADEWTKYDPEASMKMPTRHFWKLIAELKPPLGIARRATRSALLNLLHNELWIPEHEGEIHFVETLVPLARRTHIGAEFTEDQIREHEIYWHQQVPELSDLAVQRFRQKRIGVQHYFAQQFIGAAFRRCVAREKVERKFDQKIRAMEEYYNRGGVPKHLQFAVIRLKERKVQRVKRQELEEIRVANSAREIVQKQQLEQDLQQQQQASGVFNTNNNNNAGLMTSSRSAGHFNNSASPYSSPGQHSLRRGAAGAGGTDVLTHESSSLKRNESELNSKMTRRRSVGNTNNLRNSGGNNNNTNNNDNNDNSNRKMGASVIEDDDISRETVIPGSAAEVATADQQRPVSVLKQIDEDEE